MKNNAEIVWNYLGSNGWTLNAVSALLGNMQSESNINPDIWEGLNYGNMSGGYGLVQWTPATKYINWAGSNWQNPNRQLARIQWEVDNNQQWFGNPQAPVPTPPISFKQFSTSTIATSTLANYFLWYYEHPYQTIQPQRAEQAENWYRVLSGKEPKPPDGDDGSGDSDTSPPLWLLFNIIRGGDIY